MCIDTLLLTVGNYGLFSFKYECVCNYRYSVTIVCFLLSMSVCV